MYSAHTDMYVYVWCTFKYVCVCMVQMQIFIKGMQMCVKEVKGCYVCCANTNVVESGTYVRTYIG